MISLSSQLILHCRRVFINCLEFDSDEALRAVFVSDELALFSDTLPEANNKIQRVDLLIHYLLQKKLNDGRFVFPLFILNLRDRYQLGDSQRGDLDNLYIEIKAEMMRVVSAHGYPIEERKTDVDEITLNAQSPLREEMAGKTMADFVIITALEEERDALLSKIPNFRKLPQTQGDISVYYSTEFLIPTSENPVGAYRIVLMPLLGMGQIQAVAATVNSIQRWIPRYVLMVGIAGGVAANDVKLGDILIANQIVDYELQKITPEGPEIRWVVHQTDPRLLGAAQNLRDDEWQVFISEIRPEPGSLKRHIGPIASGNKVIAFNEVLKKFKDIWTKLIGVEMEASGVATASSQASSRPGFFIIRGVSDLADKKKSSTRVKKWRRYACDVAAAYAIGLLRCMPVEPQINYHVDHQSAEYSERKLISSNKSKQQLNEIHALIKHAYEMLEDQLSIFLAGGEIYSDQCENAINAISDLEKVVNTILSMMPSQYKTLMPVIHLQQRTKGIKDLLIEFQKTCPQGDSDKMVKISGQIELIKNSLIYLENTILNGH